MAQPDSPNRGHTWHGHDLYQAVIVGALEDPSKDPNDREILYLLQITEVNPGLTPGFGGASGALLLEVQVEVIICQPILISIGVIVLPNVLPDQHNSWRRTSGPCQESACWAWPA